MPSRTTASLALVAAAGTLGALPATVAAARPKAEGSYSYIGKGDNPMVIGVTVAKHKIIGVNVGTKFKKHGKLCPAPGETTPGLVSVQLDLREHPKAVSKSGDFSFKGTGEASGSKPTSAKVTVSGTFTSSTNAKVKITGSFRGCTGSFSTKKAKYQAGGR